MLGVYLPVAPRSFPRCCSVAFSAVWDSVPRGSGSPVSLPLCPTGEHPDGGDHYAEGRAPQVGLEHHSGNVAGYQFRGDEDDHRDHEHGSGQHEEDFRQVRFSISHGRYLPLWSRVLAAVDTPVGLHVVQSVSPDCPHAPVSGYAALPESVSFCISALVDVVSECFHVPLQCRNSRIVLVPAGEFACEPEQAPGVVKVVVSPPLGADIESASVQLGVEPAPPVAARPPSSLFPSSEKREPAELQAQNILGVVPVHQVGQVRFCEEGGMVLQQSFHQVRTRGCNLSG